MSYYYAEKLDMFADLATYSHQDDIFYRDASEPDNIKAAGAFFEEELGFLSGSDKMMLGEAWQAAIDDCRDTKLLFSAVKVLKGKYR